LSIRNIVVAIFVAVLIAAAFFWLPARDLFVPLELYIRTLGVFGPVAMALLYAVATVLLIPGGALPIACGALFGLRTGLMVCLTGANVGALIAFYLARNYLRKWVVSWAENTEKFVRIDRAVRRHGFKIVLLARLSPVLPFPWLNYLFGVTSVPLRAYVLADLLGMLPAALLYTYIGAAARDVLSPEVAPGGAYITVLKYAGLAATVVLVVVLTRVARKALREAEAASDREFPSDGEPVSAPRHSFR
jgi:uncharacterized membrane protein YdjX (TVP38/TMEM64 family)